jgi:hypothetical protein
VFSQNMVFLKWNTTRTHLGLMFEISSFKFTF